MSSQKGTGLLFKGKEKSTEDCISSASGQTYPDIEHVIIDGGSTDKTLDIVGSYRVKIAKFILLRYPYENNYTKL